MTSRINNVGDKWEENAAELTFSNKKKTYTVFNSTILKDIRPRHIRECSLKTFWTAATCNLPDFNGWHHDNHSLTNNLSACEASPVLSGHQWLQTYPLRLCDLFSHTLRLLHSKLSGWSQHVVSTKPAKHWAVYTVNQWALGWRRRHNRCVIGIIQKS